MLFFRNSNVLIMCTSNMDNSLDSALMDRIDFAQSVGLPGSKAALAILQDCISELSRVYKVYQLLSHVIHFRSVKSTVQMNV